jgi:hypothetical protein
MSRLDEHHAIFGDQDPRDYFRAQSREVGDSGFHEYKKALRLLEVFAALSAHEFEGLKLFVGSLPDPEAERMKKILLETRYGAPGGVNDQGDVVFDDDVASAPGRAGTEPVVEWLTKLLRKAEKTARPFYRARDLHRQLLEHPLEGILDEAREPVIIYRP